MFIDSQFMGTGDPSDIITKIQTDTLLYRFGAACFLVGQISMLFIEIYSTGLLIVQVFWGLWLMPIDILAIKSGFLPRVLGIFLLICCAGHIISSFTPFLPDGAVSIVTQIGTVLAIGELPFFLWIILLGSRDLVHSNSYSSLA